MAFGQLTVDDVTYNSIGNGVYLLSTKQFGEPVDTIKLVPGRQDKSGTVTMGLVKTNEIDNTLNGVTTRPKVVMSVNWVIQPGHVLSTADTQLSRISNLATIDFLTRLSFGES